MKKIILFILCSLIKIQAANFPVFDFIENQLGMLEPQYRTYMSRNMSNIYHFEQRTKEQRIQENRANCTKKVSDISSPHERDLSDMHIPIEYIVKDGYLQKTIYAKNIAEVIKKYMTTDPRTNPKEAFKNKPNPKRPGYTFTSYESNYIIWAARSLPALGERFYAELGMSEHYKSDFQELLIKSFIWHVFSQKRALALYYGYIMFNLPDAPDEQKECYEEGKKERNEKIKAERLKSKAEIKAIESESTNTRIFRIPRF